MIGILNYLSDFKKQNKIKEKNIHKADDADGKKKYEEKHNIVFKRAGTFSHLIRHHRMAKAVIRRICHFGM